MSSVGSKGVIIQDTLGGDSATVTNGRLDVNAAITVASDDIDIGNVVLTDSTTGTAVHIARAVTFDNPNLDQQWLLGTNALISFRSDGSTTVGVTGIEGGSDLNAMHVAISDGTEVASVNAANQLEVSSGHNITGMVHGINGDVDATAEQLDGSTSGLDTACKRVDLMGHPDNAGDIYVGSTNAIAGDGSVGGIRLQAGDFYSIDVNNLNDIWIEASIANQKLNYIYYT